MDDRRMREGLPHNAQAEQSILGCMLLDLEAAEWGVDNLTEEDFYIRPHTVVFRSIRELEEAGTAADLVTVAEHLRTTNNLDTAGGGIYLTQLLDAVPVAANYRYYGQIIREKAQARRYLLSVMDFESKLRSSGMKDASDIKATLEETILSPEADLLGKDDGDFFDAIDAAIDAFAKRPVSLDVDGHSTGFYMLDYLSYGLVSGELVVIAARPSMGKTQLALCVGANVADPSRGQGQWVDLFSIEMSKQALSVRLLSEVSGVEQRTIRLKAATDEEKAALRAAGETIRGWKLRIHDATSGLTPGKVRRKLRKLEQEGKPSSLVLIDYIQLMEWPGTTFNRNEEMDKISRELKRIAEAHSIPVVSMAQLNRETEKRADKRPVLSDLRESGAIENNADQVWLLHLPSYYWTEQPEADQNILAEIIVAKARNGEKGTALVGCNRAKATFFDPDERELNRLVRWTADREAEEKEKKKAKGGGREEYY